MAIKNAQDCGSPKGSPRALARPGLDLAFLCALSTKPLNRYQGSLRAMRSPKGCVSAP